MGLTSDCIQNYCHGKQQTQDHRLMKRSGQQKGNSLNRCSSLRPAVSDTRRSKKSCTTVQLKDTMDTPTQ
eukprot:12566149-Ditylum_brightwellii.AAC.1